MTGSSDKNVVAAWTALQTSARVLLDEVGARLKAAGLPTLAWYDVLLELDRAEPDPLRPYQLQDRLLLPQYATSRLLQKIEAAGLIASVPAPEDGRGTLLTLTDAGRAMRRRIWPVYSKVLNDLIGSRLTQGEAATLAELLKKLGVGPGTRAP